MRNIHFALILSGLCSPVHAAWEIQQSPVPDASFRAVQALDAEVAWIGGSGSTCLRTLDGGATWTALAVPGAELLDFRGLAAFDRDTAVLVSAGRAEEGKARIYRTADGGGTWQLAFETQTKGVFLDGVRFWDARNGIVFGDPVDGAWYLLVTNDGGVTWKRVVPEGFPAMQAGEAAFAASNSALIVGGTADAWIASGGAQRARVFRSQDRGRTWAVTDTPMPSGPTAGIFGLFIQDSGFGVGVGGDHKEVEQASANVIVTTDAGASWSLTTQTDPPGLKEAVVLLSEHELLTVGASGSAISSDRGGTWRKIDTRTFHAASCVGGHCWAVGGKGLIARWE